MGTAYTLRFDGPQQQKYTCKAAVYGRARARPLAAMDEVHAGGACRVHAGGACAMYRFLACYRAHAIPTFTWQKHELRTTSSLVVPCRASLVQAEGWSNAANAWPAIIMVNLALPRTAWVYILSITLEVVHLLFASQGVWSFLRPLSWCVRTIRKQGGRKPGRLTPYTISSRGSPLPIPCPGSSRFTRTPCRPPGTRSSRRTPSPCSSWRERGSTRARRSCTTG